MTPETALWFEVLTRAIMDAVGLSRAGGRTARARLAREAIEWFFSNSHELGSFIFCCQAVGVDPGAIRRGLTPVNLATIRREYKRRTAPIPHRGLKWLDEPLSSGNRHVSAMDQPMFN